MVLNFVTMIYYDLDFYASSRDHPEFPPIPNWVWLMCAINNFLSHTLGKSFNFSSMNTSQLVIYSAFTFSVLNKIIKSSPFDEIITSGI